MSVERPHAQEGTILLLALLIMSGVLIVGASLGTISLINLRSAHVIDDAVVGFAAAESGSEQTLYQLRRAGTSSADLNAYPSDDDDSALAGPAMTNGSSWERALTSDETTLFTSIPLNKTYEIVLWDPETPASPAGVESLAFSWDDDCGGTSGIEVLAAGWDPGAAGGFNPVVGFHGDSPTLTFLHTEPEVVDNGFDASKAYRVRVRAKNCDIFNMAVTAYDADDGAAGPGLVVPIPSRVAVTVSGDYGSARQALQLTLPRLQPLSGVFDYVIFSQCSILKGVSGSSCP